METLCLATGVDNPCAHFAWRRHVNLMFDARSASMARKEARAAVEAWIWYTEAIVAFMRWRMPHRSQQRDERHMVCSAQGRCWNTRRGLTERVNQVHVPKTYGASDPASPHCKLTQL